jgi:hypothetical protein
VGELGQVELALSCPAAVVGGPHGTDPRGEVLRPSGTFGVAAKLLGQGSCRPVGATVAARQGPRHRLLEDGVAALLHRLPKVRLRQLQLIVSAETILRWHRDLIHRRHANGSRKEAPGTATHPAPSRPLSCVGPASTAPGAACRLWAPASVDLLRGETTSGAGVDRRAQQHYLFLATLEHSADEAMPGHQVAAVDAVDRAGRVSRVLKCARSAGDLAQHIDQGLVVGQPGAGGCPKPDNGYPESGCGGHDVGSERVPDVARPRRGRPRLSQALDQAPRGVALSRLVTGASLGARRTLTPPACT